MIKCIKHIVGNYQLVMVTNRMVFSSKKEKQKIQTVGFANNNIQDFRCLTYKARIPIKYVNGKFLIYSSKSSLWRLLRDYFVYGLALLYFIYKLYEGKKINAVTYEKYVFIGGILITGIFIARKVLINQNVVKQIYLMEGGRATQIVFQNQIKRKLFRESLSNTYYNSLFSPPKEINQHANKLKLLPQDFENMDKRQINVPILYWQKFYSNDKNYLLIPTKYNYLHKQILSHVMQGKIIIC